jgi:hypothetical protein
MLVSMSENVRAHDGWDVHGVGGGDERVWGRVMVGPTGWSRTRGLTGVLVDCFLSVSVCVPL